MGRKKAEQERTSELLSPVDYRQVAENSHTGIWVIDPQAVTLYANPSMGRMLGFEPQELIGRSAFEFVFEEDRGPFERAFAENLARGWRPEMDLRYRRRDGTELWARVSVQPIHGANGAAAALAGMFTDVTDRRVAERELQRMSQRLQGLFEYAPMGQAVFEAVPPYRVLAHNRIYQEYWDEPFRSRGLTGLGVGEYVPNVEQNGILQVYREVARSGEARTLHEFPLEGLERGRTYWDWHVSPVVEEGMVTALAHTLIEVTSATQNATELARRVAEVTGELHHELETLQQIVDNIPVMLVFYDPGGAFGMVNRAFEERIGWSSSDLKEIDLMEVCYPDPAYRAEVFEYMRQAVPGFRDFRIRTRDGEDLDSAWANVRLSDGSQIGIGIDISERKRTETALRRSEERLALALQASRSGVFEYGLSDDYAHHNLRFQEMLGYGAGEIPEGTRFRSWLLQRTQAEDRKRFEEALSGLESGAREAISEEVAIRCASGRYLPANVQARAMRWEKREGAARIVGVAHDLSARRRIEQELEEGRILAERRAEELQRLALELTESEERERRRLARILHDELQQYLAAAKLKLSGVEGVSRAEFRQVSREASELLDRAIGVSRSLTSELSPAVLYNAGLSAALAWLGEWMERHHELAVEVCTDGAAEPQSSGVRILLFQAARELLFNVVKHSGARRAVLSLQRQEDDRLILGVSDHGKGFDPGALAGRKGVERGFGLLSISERLQLLGGSVRIDSSPDRGTNVVVSLPDRVMWTEAAGSPFAQSTVGGAGMPGEPRAGGPAPTRVLIADDHAVVRQGFASLMQRTPEVEVVALASDGEMAVRLADSLRPDVVLMDVAMPQMSGIEATRRIHGAHPEIRVIGLSIHDEKETRKAMLEAGAAEYLTKDGPAELLLAAISGRSIPEV